MGLYERPLEAAREASRALADHRHSCGWCLLALSRDEIVTCYADKRLRREEARAWTPAAMFGEEVRP